MARGAWSLLALAACTPSGTLSELGATQVDVHAAHGEGGRSLLVQLLYAGGSGHCFALDGLRGSIGDVRLTVDNPGEWRDTQLAGSASYCRYPELSAPGLEVEPTTIHLEDSTAAIDLEIPTLWAPRSWRVTIPDGPLLAGAPLDLTFEGPDDDAPEAPLLIVNSEERSGCKARELFRAQGASIGEGRYAATVPDRRALSDYTLQCEDGSALFANGAVAATLRISAGDKAKVALCRGPDTCRALVPTLAEVPLSVRL